MAAATKIGMIRTQTERPLVMLFVFAVVLIFYLALARALMKGPDFNDETEKLIAAMLIAEDKRLYREIFVQHGPVAYMLSHLLYVLAPVQDIAVQRILPFLLSLGAVGAVMMSPLLRSGSSRLLAGTIVLAGLASTQAIYGFMLAMYQVYAGHLMVAALALFVIPFALVCPVRPWQAIVGGACLALVFLCAFSFGPALGLCALACLARYVSNESTRRSAVTTLLEALKGCVAAIVLVALWMAFFADFKGYVVDHIYFNLTAYKYYLAGIDPLKVFNLLVPGRTYQRHATDDTWFTHVLFTIPSLIFCVWVASLFLQRLPFRMVISKFIQGVLLLLIVIWTNPRFSIDFGASTYIIVVIGTYALAAASVYDRYGSSNAAGMANLAMVAVLAGVAHQAQLTMKTYLYGATPTGYYKLRGALRPEKSPSMNLLREVLQGDRHALQLPFNLHFYTRAGVVPASGIFYWMPWMNDYSKDPVPGYELNLCGDMERGPPKAISYSDSEGGTWGHLPDTYLSCFQSLLKRKYVAVPALGSIWLRADVAAGRPDLLETAVVFPELETSWLGDSQRVALLAAQKGSQVIRTAQCLERVMLPAPAPAPVSACDGTMVLRGSILVSAATGQCVEIEGASTQEGGRARYWPCTGIANQTFEKLTAGNGFLLRSKFSLLCLKAMYGQLVQARCENSEAWH
jgi:hypothetical protein